MKRLAFTSFIILFQILFGFSQVVKQMTDFSAINVIGNIKAELIKSNEQKVEITFLKGNEKDLFTEVFAGELKLKLKATGMTGKSIASIKIYYKNLSEITASNGASINSKETLASAKFFINASSGAKINLTTEGQYLDASASSGSSIVLQGKIMEEGKFSCNSGSTIDAVELSAVKVDANASSGSRLTVWTLEEITASSNSGGHIKYKGEPKTKNIKSGAFGNYISQI